MRRQLIKTIAISLALLGLTTGQIAPVQAQGIEQLLVTNPPVPTPRPVIAQAPKQPATASQVLDLQIPETSQTQVSAIRGSLKEGLRAIRKGDANRAMGIRLSMPGGSLDRKILAWAIAISGNSAVSAKTVSDIANDLKDWPAQGTMAANIERALSRSQISSQTLIGLLGKQELRTEEGTIALAKAYRSVGQQKTAHKTIAHLWKTENLDRATEKQVLKDFGSLLKRQDHRHRMHQQFYNDRSKSGLRVAALAEQYSLAKARAATLTNASNAKSLLSKVAASSKRDTGFRFAQIEYHRRNGEYEKAADLLGKATRDPTKLVDPDEWWVERRITSREMLEKGNAKLAYKLVSEHSAQSAASIADAEFHAGWYALRFLKDSKLAKKHFAKILQVSSRPISVARGNYWMGRASRGAEARRYYETAANYSGTYYGQLAAVELGRKKLDVKKPNPSAGDRQRYKTREQVRALKRLEALGFDGYAGSFYRHLAATLQSPEELALLAADAERNGDYNLSLQVGKLAYGRGLPVPTLSWPIGAIPGSAKIGDTGLALAYAIARQESAFNKSAVSPANARGLLQLLPGTAKAVARRQGLKYSRKRLTTDAGYNATLGAAYLSEQLENFGNSYVLTLAAYNAGPTRVNEWLERFGDPRGKPLHAVIDWVEQIPFTETRHYVQRILENYQVYKARIGGSRLEIVNDLTKGRR